VSGYIIICDDEPFLRDMIASYLSMSGYSVVEALDGEECIEQVEEKRPDAILLDLNMPKMNGLETLKRLRDFGHDYPIIVITGDPSQGKIAEAERIGIQGLLVKPFHVAAIREELAKVLPPLLQLDLGLANRKVQT